jgi:hypothetical protein
VRLLTSRSGVRASQGAFRLLNLSFGTLCATIQIVTMRCIDLHPFWQVYVRMPLGFRSISKKKAFILQEVPGNFIRFLWTCVLLRIASDSMICIYFARATPRDFIGFCAIHGASKTCLGATPLDQGYDGTEIKYFANCNEGRGAAGSAWCP